MEAWAFLWMVLWVSGHEEQVLRPESNEGGNKQPTNKTKLVVGFSTNKTPQDPIHVEPGLRLGIFHSLPIAPCCFQHPLPKSCRHLPSQLQLRFSKTWMILRYLRCDLSVGHLATWSGATNPSTGAGDLGLFSLNCCW